jgi:hypothetical protein
MTDARVRASCPWAVVEGVLEPVLFDHEPWAHYVITEAAVRGGAIERLDSFGLPSATTNPGSPAAPLRRRLARRSAEGS